MVKPLDGVRIADFTVHNAGPFATHMLSLLGAECIKIESAQRPDIFRKPHPVYGRLEPATFDQVASNKLSVRINLKHPRGIVLARRLVAVCDVAAESFRPGVMTRLGLGYDALRDVKPDIILLAISSSGQSGPDSHFAGYAPLFGAWGGLGALTGYADGPPVEMRHVMDHTVGLNAALAVVAALHRRRATGHGALVDVAAREVASSLLGEAMLMASAGLQTGRTGNDHPAMAPHGVYPAKGHDRWISIAVRTDAEWRALARLMGQPRLSTDPRFAAVPDRLVNRRLLDTLVSDWTVTMPPDAAATLLQSAGIAAHASWTAADIVADPHLGERGAIVEVTEPDGRGRAAVGAPMRLSKSPEIGIARGTPKLGEHEDYVFGELLCMSSSERQELQDERVIY